MSGIRHSIYLALGFNFCFCRDLLCHIKQIIQSLSASASHLRMDQLYFIWLLNVVNAPEEEWQFSRSLPRGSTKGSFPATSKRCSKPEMQLFWPLSLLQLSHTPMQTTQSVDLYIATSYANNLKIFTKGCLGWPNLRGFATSLSHDCSVTAFGTTCTGQKPKWQFRV